MEYISTNYRDLEKAAEALAPMYKAAAPFPNICLQHFFDDSFLSSVLAEFPDLNDQPSRKFDDPEKQVKMSMEHSFGPNTTKLIRFMNAAPMLSFLQKLTSIKETLIGDPYFVGGGLHETKPGGLLKIHADFNKHRLLHLDRRVNVLIYLNKDWEEAYGGHFELWNKEMTRCEKRILPVFNTMAIFSTTTHSYHGHPDPLTCPEGMSRKSLALYYYSNGRPAHEIIPGQENHSTIFKEKKS